MVLWVDIDSGAVYEEAIRGGTVTVTRDLAFTTTVIAVAVADDGTLLDAGRDPLLHVARDGAVATIAHVIGPGSPLRLINGVCDPASRFLIGSQALDERTGEEGLYRLERGLSITVVDADLTFSNGLGWSETGGFSTPSRVRVRPDPPGHECPATAGFLALTTSRHASMAIRTGWSPIRREEMRHLNPVVVPAREAA